MSYIHADDCLYIYNKPQAWNNVSKATANINLHRARCATLTSIMTNNNINRDVKYIYVC